MLSWPSLGSRIEPSDVAVIISPNAGVIGTRHVDRHASKLRLFVPDRPAPESISHDVEDDMLLIVMLLGTMNILTDFSSFSFSITLSSSLSSSLSFSFVVSHISLHH